MRSRKLGRGDLCRGPARLWPGTARQARSVVAVNPLTALVALLGVDAQGGDGPGFEPAQADWVAGLLAVPVRARLDPLQRGVDLDDQLALAVAGAQFNRAIGLG